MISIIFFGWSFYLFTRGTRAETDMVKGVYYGATVVFYIIGFISLKVGL